MRISLLLINAPSLFEMAIHDMLESTLKLLHADLLCVSVAGIVVSSAERASLNYLSECLNLVN